MKIIVLRNNLKDGLAIVEKMTGDNLNLPILKNLLLETEGNKIKISATNLEIAGTTFISGKVVEEGKITISSSVFASLISNLKNERIDLESKNNDLIVKTDNYEATIRGLSASDFPVIPKIESDQHSIELNTTILKEAFSKVISSTGSSDLRPEISSILFDFKLNNIKLVATDSFRLAEKTIFDDQFKTNFIKPFKVLIPLKTIQELLRSLNDNVSVSIFIDQNQILFKTDELEIISRLVDGNFPDYDQIIPKELQTEVILNKDEFMNAIKLAGIFTGKTGDVKIKTMENKKTIEINSIDQNTGENNYLIPAKINGELVEARFNWKYLIDGLKISNSEDIIFGLNGGERPAVIKSPKDQSYFYILMPIRNI